MLHICKYCQSSFRPHPKVPHQKFCSRETCQKARRRLWQKMKLQNDDDYKQNQKDAQQAWTKKNPNYWRIYRKNHPLYVARNKILQKKRNIKSRHGLTKSQIDPHMIAKMDELAPRSNIVSGYYRLSPVVAGNVAKMDAILVKIDLFLEVSLYDLHY